MHASSWTKSNVLLSTYKTSLKVHAFDPSLLHTKINTIVNCEYQEQNDLLALHTEL